MSTANAQADVQTGQKVVLPEHGQSELTEPKFTATQIENDCPARLQQIGKEIKERLEKARKYHQQAEDHLIAVNARINEAKRLCDDGGFNKFRELFCPELGKSQAYVLHAIGSGKKTLEQHLKEQRDRKRKSRAQQKSQPANSVTVTEKPNEGEGSTGTSALQVTNSTTEQTPELSKPRNAVAPGDEALRAFTVRTMELHRTTDKRQPKRFAATPVPVEVLEQLGNLLIGIANLKKSRTVRPTSTSPKNDVPSSLAPKDVEQPALEAAVAVGA
jgi:hypothetical protein